jgi:hypothetical protein
MEELTIKEWLDAGYTASYPGGYQYSTYLKLLDNKVYYAFDYFQEDFDFNNLELWSYYGNTEIDYSKLEKVQIGTEKPEHLAGCLSSFQEAFNHIMQGGKAEFCLDRTIICCENGSIMQLDHGSYAWIASKPEYFSSDSWKLI